MINNQANQSNRLVQKDNTNPTVIFEAVYQAFQQAQEFAGGSLDRFYSIAGQVIRLRFAGTALEPRIAPALEQLATAPTIDPALTICLWDDVSSHTTMPSPPWLGYGVYNPYGDLQGVYTRRGDVRGYNNERIRIAFHMGADVLNMLDTDRNLALYWTHNAIDLPLYEIGSPLRTVLHWWLRQYGLQFLHSGAVGTAKGGVLLAGKGGSGKSTTALSCLNSELAYVSDDYCLVGVDPTPFAYNLYNTAKVRPDNINRLPHLRHMVSNPHQLDTEKALLFLHQYLPEKIVAGFPIQAILLPRVTGRSQTTLTSASLTAGLSALVLSTMNQLAGAGPAALAILKRLVDQIPCYYLELGTDLAQIPGVILDLLAAASVNGRDAV